MRKFYSLWLLAFMAVNVIAADFTKGVFFLNEDWFGHNPSSVNFLSEDNEWTYNAFQAANPGRSLGNTCQYATIYNKKIYFVSKQTYNSNGRQGGRFIVADAKTLKQESSIDDLNGADGRAFLPVSDEKGYISTSNGIITYNMANHTLGQTIEGLSGEYGNMLAAEGYLFAVGTSEGLRAIQINDNSIVRTWSGAKTAVQSKDGTIWYTTGKELIGINPGNLETIRTISLSDEAQIPSNYTWNAGTLFASAQTNTLYWGGGGGFSGYKQVWKLNLDAEGPVAEKIIDLTGSEWSGIYGAAIRISPETDHIYMQLFKGFSSTDYTVYETDPTGKLVAEYPLEQKNYWYPSLVIFPEQTKVQSATDFSEGVFFINEDWSGHNPGSVNFLSEDGTWTYNAFQSVNPGRSLGNITQFASIYNNRIYFISKQPYQTEDLKGGRLVVADARTLQQIVSFDELNGTDGRAFVAASRQKGYISTSNGILTYNMAENTLGQFIEGLSGEYGTMLIAGNYLFAIGTSEGLRAIDLTNDQIAKTWNGVKQITRSKDGCVWAYSEGKLQGIDPATLNETQTVELEHEIEHDAWAWKPGSLFASAQTNTLYWGGKGSGYYGSDNLWKLDLDAVNPKAEKIFDLTGSEWVAIYGSAMRIDPVTDHLYIQLYKDYGNQEYTVFELDNEGNKVAEYPLEKANCWFPSLPVFTEEGTLNGMETPDIQNEISSPFKLTGNQLTVKGMAGKKLLIFRPDGTLVTTYAVNNNLDILTLSIPSGLYIIQSGNASVKIRIDQ